jgi:hypothetical protein
LVVAAFITVHLVSGVEEVRAFLVDSVETGEVVVAVAEEMEVEVEVEVEAVDVR